MPIRALDLALRLAILITISWVLYSSLQVGATVLPPELQMAERALKANDVVQAKRVFEQYLKKHPGSLNDYKVIIELCELYNRPDLMVEYSRRSLQECRDASPADKATLYCLLSGAYLASGKANASKAQVDAAEALALDKDNPVTLNNYAYVLAETSTEMSELNRAEQMAAQALKRLNGPVGLTDQGVDFSMCEDTYGWVLYKKGLYGPQQERADYLKRAVDALVQASDAMPSQTAAENAKVYYYHLGAAYRRLGRADDARRALNVALNYDPKYAEAQAELQALDAAARPPTATQPSAPTSPPTGSQASSAPAFTPLASPPSAKPGKP